MAGAWAESGSLPSIYFEVFEWTEARALPPKYKLSGPKSAAAAHKVYSSLFSHVWPSTFPSPGNSSSACLPQLPPPPPPPTPESTRFSHFSASASPLAGHSAFPPRPSHRPRCPRSTQCPWKRLLLPRPPPPSAPDPGLTGSPDHEVRGSLPSAPLEVTLARLRPGRRRPSDHARPLRSPDWAGRRPRHSAPRALAGPNAGSGTALPRPAANDPSRKGNKASGPGVRSAWASLARPPPGHQQSSSPCLAPPAWLTHRSPHASCRRGNPPPGPTGVA